MSKHNKEKNKVVWLQIFKNKMLQNATWPIRNVECYKPHPQIPFPFGRCCPSSREFLGVKNKWVPGTKFKPWSLCWKRVPPKVPSPWGKFLLWKWLMELHIYTVQHKGADGNGRCSLTFHMQHLVKAFIPNT